MPTVAHQQFQVAFPNTTIFAGICQSGMHCQMQLAYNQMFRHWCMRPTNPKCTVGTGPLTSNGEKIGTTSRKLMS